MQENDSQNRFFKYLLQLSCNCRGNSDGSGMGGVNSSRTINTTSSSVPFVIATLHSGRSCNGNMAIANCSSICSRNRSRSDGRVTIAAAAKSDHIRVLSLSTSSG